MTGYNYVIYQSDFKTAIGSLYYLWKTGRGNAGGKIRIIYLGNMRKCFIAYRDEIRSARMGAAGLDIMDKKSPEIEEKIKNYLGSSREITGIEPEFLTGSEFEKKIWKAAFSIPSGVTTSYGKLAGMAGYPSAARAAGNALGKNPIMIIVPCHRVIRGDGGIGGFFAGTNLKKKLLQLEALGIKPA